MSNTSSALGHVITNVSTLDILVNKQNVHVVYSPTQHRESTKVFSSYLWLSFITTLFPFIEIAKEGIPFPFGNKFWASNWPTGKTPPCASHTNCKSCIYHFCPLFIAVIIVIGPPFSVNHQPFCRFCEYFQGICLDVLTIPFHSLCCSHVFSWLPFAAFLLAASIFCQSLMCSRLHCWFVHIIAPFLHPPNDVGDPSPLPYYLLVHSAYSHLENLINKLIDYLEVHWW